MGLILQRSKNRTCTWLWLLLFVMQLFLACEPLPARDIETCHFEQMEIKGYLLDQNTRHPVANGSITVRDIADRQRSSCQRTTPLAPIHITSGIDGEFYYPEISLERGDEIELTVSAENCQHYQIQGRYYQVIIPAVTTQLILLQCHSD